MPTSDAQKAAAETYRQKQLKAGRRRLSGALVPIHINTLLDELAERTGIESTSALLWYCVEEAVKKDRRRG